MKIIGNMGKTKKSPQNINFEEKNNFEYLLNKIVRDVKISEGRKSLEDILRCIYRNQPISTKK